MKGSERQRCLNGCLNDVRYGLDFSDTHPCVFFFFFECIRSPEKLIYAAL